jgi:nitrite reductase (NADH) small subunit/3-phenylpropionate/trans-cinnamate dioxygenase ferredoxin subunit
MNRWFEVAKMVELSPGQGRTVVAGDLRLALFNNGGEFFAIDDSCPHQGASLGGGVLHDGRVICPWHGWIFELRTGKCPRDTHEPVATYRTRRSGDLVEVQVPE